MEIEIIEFRNKDDDPEMIEEATIIALYVNNELVLSGDNYHDKIDAQIEGYLKALKVDNPNTRKSIHINGYDIPKDFTITKPITKKGKQ